MESLRLLLSLALLGSAVAYYEITGISQQEIHVKQGEAFEVICTAYDYYEWCTFKHADKMCEIEWKRTPYNVTMGPCADYEGRMEFRGEYNKYECGLKIDAATAEDNGEWSCDIESYVKGGSRGSGETASKKFRVFVEVPTTTTTTTTTTTMKTTTTVSTTSTTTDAVVIPPAQEEVLQPEDNEGESPSGQSPRTGDAGAEGEGEGNVVIIVVAICLIVIIGGLSALFGLHYKRMLHPCFYRVFSPRWKPVQTDMDLDEEGGEKHASIIKNGTDLNVSELGPMGDGANMNGDCTAVTFVAEKEDEVKKELVDAATEEEKKDDEKEKVEEKDETEKETLLKEDEENLSK